MGLPAEDEIAIIRLINRYAHTTTGCDPEAMASLFTEDGVWERKEAAAGTKYDEKVRIVGRENIREFAAANLKTASRELYLSSNSVVDGEGNTATARSMIVILNLKDTPASVYIVGTFEDELRKGPDGWKFTYRGVSLQS